MKDLLGLCGGGVPDMAAYLLQKQGYDVTCCFMRNWDSFANNDILGNPLIQSDICPQEQDYLDAKAVAEHLGLTLDRVDFIEDYWNKVFLTFLEEYKKGRTPNPDILCNQYIKFDAFFQYAMDHGYDMVATGHYASTQQKDGFTYLARAADTNKDQTYFLCQVAPEAIAKTLFPLGNISKPEVRKLAEELDLESVMKKKDSTGICFIGERNFREFLSNYLPSKPGEIIDINTGKVVGEHMGVLYYTIGQRKGLHIDHEKGPWFVIGKDVETNRLFVTHHTQKQWLSSDQALIKNINWIVEDKTSIPQELTCKFRYRQKDQDVKLKWITNDSVLLSYPQGIEGVTEGQEAVLYDGELCLGGGVIDVVYKEGKILHDTILQRYEELRHGRD